jgi:CBS domain-containing protein
MDGLAEADGLLEPEDAVLDRPVQDFMSRQVITTSEQAPMGEIADLMVSHRVHRLIIVRDEKAAGIVSVMDILRALRDRHRAGA